MSRTVFLFIAAIVLGSLRATGDEPPPFLRNGQPFFPFGIYHYPGGNEQGHMAELGEAGINLVRQSLSMPLSFLDEAQAHGVYVMAEVSYWMNDIARRGDALVAAVNQRKHHPALYAYETIDEPHWNRDCYQRGPYLHELVEGYNRIKQVDPERPMMLNFAPIDLTSAHPICGATFTVESYRPWLAAGDIYGMDRYPVWGNAFPNENLNPVSFVCDKLREITGPGKTVYMVLQGVGMLEWDSDPNNDGRRPNWIETRFMGYSSVIHGARGLLYWGQYYITPDAELWSSIKRLASEFRVIGQPIAAGERLTGWTAANPNLEGLLKRHENRLYLILANRSSGRVPNAALHCPGLGTPALEVLFENRSLPHTQGSFRDTFEPWEVHVYTGPVAQPAVMETR